MYTHEEKKDHICTSKNLKSMSEFDGLWKQQHNPLCCCFHSPSNSDMDLRFFDVHMWSFFFMRVHSDLRRTFATSAQNATAEKSQGGGIA